jgi:hypothetical protein
MTFVITAEGRPGGKKRELPLASWLQRCTHARQPLLPPLRRCVHNRNPRSGSCCPLHRVGLGSSACRSGRGITLAGTSPGVAALDRVEAILRNPETYKLASLIRQPSRETGGRGRDYPHFMYLVFEALISVYASARQVEVGLSPPEARIGVAGPPPRPSQPQRSPGTPWRACRQRRCFLWFVTINQALADGSLDKVAGGDDNRIRTPTPQ